FIAEALALCAPSVVEQRGVGDGECCLVGKAAEELEVVGAEARVVACGEEGTCAVLAEADASGRRPHAAVAAVSAGERGSVGGESLTEAPAFEPGGGRCRRNLYGCGSGVHVDCTVRVLALDPDVVRGNQGLGRDEYVLECIIEARRGGE